MSLPSSNGSYNIMGDFTVEQASKIYYSIKLSEIESQHITVDLSQIDQSDSAALAVMLEWTNIAKNINKSIQFNDVPDQLMKLINMTQLQTILNISDKS